MPFRIRAASLAAVSHCSAMIAGFTSPGLAQEVKDNPIAMLNAVTQAQVPAAVALSDAVDVLEDPTVVRVPLDQDVPAATLRPAIVEDADTETQYSSLADAVAAQDAAVEERELECLAAGVFYESNGEPLAGQLAVAHTILNRTRSGRFPKSVCGVLTQRGQFSFVRGGVVPNAEGRRGWNTAVAVAKVAYADLWDSAAPKALFFHARHASPGWRMARVATVGNHVFYR